MRWLIEMSLVNLLIKNWSYEKNRITSQAKLCGSVFKGKNSCVNPR
jgi:hypothetical protein